MNFLQKYLYSKFAIKRLVLLIVNIFALISFFFTQNAFAQEGYLGTETGPRHLRDTEVIVVELILIAWSLSIFYFTAIIAITGFQYMFSGGDSNRTAELKDKVGKIGVGFLIVFSSWLVVTTLTAVLKLETPDGSCFSGQQDTGTLLGSLFSSFRPMFVFFFPNACN